MTNTDDGVKTIRTCLRILEELQDHDGSTPEIVAEELGISERMVQRYLSTLYNCGYLQREGETYFVGYRFLNLGESIRYRKGAYRKIADKLADLARETGLETDFSVLDHGRVIVIHQVHQDENYWDSRSVGTYYYMHSTSAGKAILAELTSEKVEKIVTQWGLPRQTENTITDRDELDQALDATRQRGYGLNDEESTEGLRSIGCTLHWPDGTLLGSISISGPSYRVSDTAFREKLPDALKGAVEDLVAEI